MLTRLLKMLSGLTLFWACRRPQKVTGRNGGVPPDPSEPTEVRADYRVCDTCGAFLSGADSSRFACRECAANRVRHGPRPVRASAAAGGVEASLPLDCLPGAERPVAERPVALVRIAAGLAKELSRMLLKPGSDDMAIGLGRNGGLLTAGWSGGGMRLNLRSRGEPVASLTLSRAQAGRLGDDIAGCLGIDVPACDREFVDARVTYCDHEFGPTACARCGAIRAEVAYIPRPRHPEGHGLPEVRVVEQVPGKPG